MSEILAGIASPYRRQLIRKHWKQETIEQLNAELFNETLSEPVRKALGRIHLVRGSANKVLHKNRIL